MDNNSPNSQTDPIAQNFMPGPEQTSGPQPATGKRPYTANAPLVEISDQFLPLDARHIQAERISGLIVSSLFLIAGLIAGGVLWANLGFSVVWFSIVGAALLLIGASFLASILWPAIDHRNASWRLDKEGLEIHRGVFWKHQITIPLGRVQHADVSQGPLQRPFGIGTLAVHTAGTQNASVTLEGLAHETALELRDKIVSQRKDQ